MDELLEMPRVRQRIEQAKQAKDESERLEIIKLLFQEIRNNSDSVVDKLDDGVTIGNFDEVQAALRNEFLRNTKVLLKALEGLKLSTDQQTTIINALKNESEKDNREDFQKIIIKNPKKTVTIGNLQDILFPDNIQVNNLADLKEYFDNLSKVIEKTFNIHIPSPKVTVRPPAINIPQQEINIPEVSFDPIIDSLERQLNKIKTNSKSRPLAVRLTDGQDWIKKLEAVVDNMKQTVQGFSDMTYLKNKTGKTINPATDEALGARNAIVSGTKTVTTAGTAVQITATATPCKEVWLSGDTGNSDLVVVGDSSVVAAAGTQQGIVIIPGNTSIRLQINDLSKLWVDSISNGDELCYAYLT